MILPPFPPELFQLLNHIIKINRLYCEICKNTQCYSNTSEGNMLLITKQAEGEFSPYCFPRTHKTYDVVK